ncbi:MAG: hypothetical protein WCR24_07475 [Candidatus Methanomethylophilaceae archaeon]
MGTTGIYVGRKLDTSDKKAILRENLSEWDSPESSGKVLKDTIKGSVYYAVTEILDKGTGKVTRLAVVSPTGMDGGEFFFKSMDETVGPCYYDIPLSYLDMLTEPMNKYSEEWRKDVVRRSEEKKRPFSDRIFVIDGKDYNGFDFSEKMAKRTGYPAYAIRETPWVKKMTVGQKARIMDTDFERTYNRKRLLGRFRR